MAESLLVGWRQIHRDLFCDKKGRPVISLDTLRKKYGPEMKSLGIVIEWKIGQGKRPSICAWPSKIQGYVTAKQRLGEL